MQDGILLQLLKTVVFQIPVLLVYLIGMGMLVTRRAGRPRTLGLWGLGLLLLVVIVGTALSLLPAWLLSQGASFGQYAVAFSVLRAFTGLMAAVGVLLVVLALRFALPPR
ncbi:hypothetical protein [Xanthomonas medicagonis]|uniref:hypothetical protein n=1 Tax=Xanthomonas medicagonis TaxID=3160841 RepID=UPI0035167561